MRTAMFCTQKRFAAGGRDHFAQSIRRKYRRRSKRASPVEMLHLRQAFALVCLQERIENKGIVLQSRMQKYAVNVRTRCAIQSRAALSVSGGIFAAEKGTRQPAQRRFAGVYGTTPHFSLCSPRQEIQNAAFLQEAYPSERMLQACSESGRKTAVGAGKTKNSVPGRQSLWLYKTLQARREWLWKREIYAPVFLLQAAQVKRYCRRAAAVCAFVRQSFVSYGLSRPDKRNSVLHRGIGWIGTRRLMDVRGIRMLHDCRDNFYQQPSGGGNAAAVQRLRDMAAVLCINCPPGILPKRRDEPRRILLRSRLENADRRRRPYRLADSGFCRKEPDIRDSLRLEMQILYRCSQIQSEEKRRQITDKHCRRLLSDRAFHWQTMQKNVRFSGLLRTKGVLRMLRQLWHNDRVMTKWLAAQRRGYGGTVRRASFAEPEGGRSDSVYAGYDAWRMTETVMRWQKGTQDVQIWQETDLKRQLDAINQKNMRAMQTLRQIRLRQEKTVGKRMEGGSLQKDVAAVMLQREEAAHGYIAPEKERQRWTAQEKEWPEKLLCRETIAILEAAGGYGKAPGSRDTHVLTGEAARRELLHDIRQNESERHKAYLQKSRSSSQSVPYDREMPGRRVGGGEREDVERVQRRKETDTRSLQLVHRRFGSDISQELLERLQHDSRRIDGETNHLRETVKTLQTRQEAVAGPVKEWKPQQMRELETLVSRRVRQQIGSLSEQIYAKIEKRLEAERRRRGI